MSSEPCVFHEDGLDSKIDCKCTTANGTNLRVHLKFEGSYKKAYYALIGPQRDVDLVHQKMQSLQTRSGVFTLIMNCDDNQATIEEEINLFEKIKEVDPHGEFTPLLLHHNRIYKNSQDDIALKKICANVKEYQNAVRMKKEAETQARIDAGRSPLEYESDSDDEKEGGEELVKQLESNEDSLYFMYVTDVGISIYDYVQSHRNLQGAEDIVRATRKLAEDYQKLAENGIGHYDMHGGNIMCIKRDGKLRLSIIDFGFGFAIEENIPRNVLHFLFSGVSFDNAVKTKEAIRRCDPVHYNMFVMCFGMLRRTLHRTRSPTVDTVHEIIEDMYHSAFERAMPAGQTKDTENFNELQQQIIGSYRDFYTIDNLKDIWKRVCEKTFLVVCDFLKRGDGMRKLSARTRVSGEVDTYVPDNYYIKATRNTTTFSILFDAFSMAFYDRQGRDCDQTFLRKKSDEYSIANISSFILKQAMNATTVSKERCILRDQCVRLQIQFSAPDFFLRNDQCVYSKTDPNDCIFPDRSAPVSPMANDAHTPVYGGPGKRMFAGTPGPAMGFQTSTPAAKRREKAPITLMYTPARPPTPSSLLSPFPVFMGSPMQQSVRANSERSPLAYQRVSGRRLGQEDIEHMQTSSSMERELPGVDTNFGEGTGFTLFNPEEGSKGRKLFSPYART